MPDKKPGEAKKAYMERCVPKLVKEGKDPKQAVAICNAMFAKAELGDVMLKPEVTKKICFCAQIAENGFKLVAIEDSDVIIEQMSFAQLFMGFGCVEGTTYEFEIEVEECDD